MNLRPFLILFTFLASSVLYAQSVELPMDYIRNKNFSQNPNSEVIQGSKYLNENFQSGKILFNNKEINTQLKYNVLLDEFELRDNTLDGVASVVRAPEIKFTMGSSNFALLSYMDKNNIAEGYFEVLNDGPNQLLKKNIVTYKEAQPAANSYKQGKPARYIASVEYYLSNDDKPAQHVLLRKKDILNILNTDEAQNYVKENKLKLKNEKEVIELLNFLNQNTQNN